MTSKRNRTPTAKLGMIAAALAAFLCLDRCGGDDEPSLPEMLGQMQQMRAMQLFGGHAQGAQGAQLEPGYNHRIGLPGGGSCSIGSDGRTSYFLGADGSSVMIGQ